MYQHIRILLAAAILVAAAATVLSAQEPLRSGPAGADRARDRDRQRNQDRERPAPRSEMIFDRIDANKDGVIDRAEFDSAADQMRRGPGRGAFGARRGPDEEIGAPGEMIRRIVRDAVNEALREHDRALRDAVRQAVDDALRDRQPDGPRINMERNAGPRRGPDGAGAPLGGPHRPAGGRGIGGPPAGDMPPPPDGRRNEARRGRGPGDPDAAQRPKAPGARDGRRQADRSDQIGDRPRDGARQGRGIGPREGRPADRRGAGRGIGDAPIMKRFDRMDANNDGVVTRDEYFGPPARFDQIDANGDGRIDREEMKRAWNKVRATRPAQGPRAGL